MNYLIHDSEDNTYLRVGKLYSGGWRNSLLEACSTKPEATRSNIDERGLLNAISNNPSYTILVTTPEPITLEYVNDHPELFI